MKLNITILLSAIIIAAALVLSSHQANTDRYFATDLLPANKKISRADVIKAVEGLDRAKLLASIVHSSHRATDFRVLDAKASIDRKTIGIFGEVVLADGTRSPLNFGFEQDHYGAWTATLGEQRFILAL
jgi:hypothetical protein